jgi:hypothetical protein
MVTLNDGRLLVLGDDAPFPTPGFDPATFAEIYDATTGAFSMAGWIVDVTGCQSAVALLDGRVLLAGCTAGADTDANFLYDPSHQSWRPTGAMTLPRQYFTATLLVDGRVLIAGGWPLGVDTHRSWPAQAELFDPSTGSFTLTGSLHTPRESATATRLADGRVLIAGGDEHPVQEVIAQAEIYDPASGTFSATGNMVTPREFDSATLMSDGRVLLVGGDSVGTGPLASAEVFDPGSGLFAATNSLPGGPNQGRHDPATVLLKDGRLLVLGGSNERLEPFNTAFLFDPVTGTFSSTGSMAESKSHPAAALLPDERVLVWGGEDTAELYLP